MNWEQTEEEETPRSSALGRIKCVSDSVTGAPTRGHGRGNQRLGMVLPDTACSWPGDSPTTAGRGRQGRLGLHYPDFGLLHQIPYALGSPNLILQFRVRGLRRCIIPVKNEKLILFLELILKGVLFKKIARLGGRLVHCIDRTSSHRV
jgi:hypothetical protein